MFAFMTKPLGVRCLTAIIVVSTFLRCLCAYWEPRVRDVNQWAFCSVVAGFGMLWCFFLAVLLVPSFYRFRRRYPFVFSLGFVIGLASFSAWFYSVNENHLEAILSMLVVLLAGSGTVHLIYHRRWPDEPKT